MSKSELLITLATLPENDPRLSAVADALMGKPDAGQPANLRLIPPGQAAKETGFSRATIWRLCREGKIKTVEIRRGSHRIPESELRRFVEGRTQ